MALPVTRSQNFADWYQHVVTAADMAENSLVRGCMVIKPWGWGIWERVRDSLDAMIKATGHENCYFPLLIPLSLFEKEAEHIDGFAKEMAMVTHTKLTEKDGKLVIDGKLDEPLVIRPTSETVIGESMAKWINSYRDLPLLLNQWANVMRWEMRTRLFLRTSEFLWQEGHTAHATREDAVEETEKMLEVYRILAEDVMAMPMIVGRKPDYDRFPGAVDTYCIEGMMQDGKALQAGTSHYLGQTFAKSANIRYQDETGEMQYCHTTSWGVSTRLIGGLIMTHSDDEGLRLPPKVAPQQIVIVPITRDNDEDKAVYDYAHKLSEALSNLSYGQEAVRVRIDRRLKKPQDKRWEWVRKGVPLVVEVGPKDIEKSCVAVTTRTDLDGKKEFPNFDEFVQSVSGRLDAIQKQLFAEALSYQQANTVTDITSWAQLEAYFAPQSGFIGGDDKTPGFVRAKWSGCPETEEKLKSIRASIRCLPLEQSGTEGTCVISGKPATMDAIFARSY